MDESMYPGWRNKIRAGMDESMYQAGGIRWGRDG